jgi:hypothetical protein
MGPLLGNARIVDVPRLDRAVSFQMRHHQFAHLGQHRPIRPRGLTDEVQQGLMLRRSARRRRQRRHRFDALALARQHQAGAIIPQRPRSIRVPDHSDKLTNIAREPPGSLFRFAENHSNLPNLGWNSPLSDSQMHYPVTFRLSSTRTIGAPHY